MTRTVYSTGLANVAGNVLRKANVHVQRESVGQKATDFSSVVSKISSDTDVVFLPWQVAANAPALLPADGRAGQAGEDLRLGRHGLR